MAEFQEVMKQYNRMNEAHRKGVTIPVEASYETAVKQPDFFEEVVMEWAAEHPEPVYPTWWDWLINYGVINGCTNKGAIERLQMTSIPADIAEKLGIEPKECWQWHLTRR